MERPGPAAVVFSVAQALLVLMISSLPGHGAENPSIFYVTGEGTRHEMRAYHPLRGTRTVLELPGEPSNIYWTGDFGTITFRVGDDIFESDWRIGSEARKAITLPSVPEASHRQIIVWRDADANRWRYYEIQYPPDDAVEWKYFARVLEYNRDTNAWETLADRETHGCEEGNGFGCGSEVHEHTMGQRRHVFRSRLAEEMRLGRLMDERGLEYEASMEEKDLWFELGGGEVSVIPIFGDSLHAMAPVKWRRGDESRIIFPADRDYTCMDQVGLGRVGGFLLVATEWYGRCGRVIDLETGETVHELPANARSAVIVPWPEGR